MTVNYDVAGSSPVGGATKRVVLCYSLFYFFFLNTKHHLKYRNLFGIFCTALHTASSQGDSLAVDQYSFSTKSAQNSFPDFKRCLVLNPTV